MAKSDPPRPAPPWPHMERFGATARHIASLPYRATRMYLRHNVGAKRWPHFLYKFKSHNAPVLHLRDIIVESKLYLSSPEDFNDPFDMKANIKFEGTAKEQERRFKEVVNRVEPGLSRKKRREKVAELKRRPLDKIRENFKDQISNMRTSAGIFAFASDPKSVVMWSHYGDHHGGVCFQFEVARDTTTFLNAVSVIYSKEYPEIDWVNKYQKTVQSLLFNKFEAWTYEGEYRLLLLRGAHTLLPFKAAALTGLVFGCNARPEFQRTVQDLLAERTARGMPPVRVYKAGLHSSEYKLVVKRFDIGTV